MLKPAAVSHCNIHNIHDDDDDDDDDFIMMTTFGVAKLRMPHFKKTLIVFEDCPESETHLEDTKSLAAAEKPRGALYCLEMPLCIICCGYMWNKTISK